MKKYIVDERASGKRLDSWLAETLGQTRSQLQKVLGKSEILVDGRGATSHYTLKGGEEVTIIPKKIESNEKAEAAATVVIGKVEIVAETKDYLVINKPAGLMMHPAEGATGPTVVDWLMKKYPAIKSVGEDPERPGIVHRLDRDVSGLVVIAKNQAFFDCVKDEFKKRVVQKFYVALVHGADLPEVGDINFRIERSTQGFKMAAKPTNQPGKVAVTLFTVLHRFHNYTLVRIQIKTGRTHQIRAHFSAYGHPVAGDDLYAGPKLKALNKKINLGRIFLTATELSFLDLKGERQTFTLEIPSDLQKFLTTLT